MAVLGKIRNQSGLLIVIVGIAMLAFILGDLFTSGRSIFRGEQTEIAEIGSKSISYEDFERKVQESIENYKKNAQKPEVDEATIDALRQQAWSQMIREEIMTKEHDEVGIAVSSDELFDMVQGKNPHPSVKQAFTNPETKEFNPAQVITFLKSLDKEGNDETRERWLAFEKAIGEERLNAKYNNLIKKGLYITTNQAKNSYFAEYKTASVSFVTKKFSTVPDSTITVDETEINNYYNTNKKKYTQKETTAKIEYVAFDVLPSDEDRQATIDWINDTKTDLKNADVDSSFVNMNAETKYTDSWYDRGILPVYLDSVLFNGQIDTVVGPYQENFTFKIAKLIDTRMVPDSVKARHILLSPGANGDNKAVFATADSLKNLLKKGSAKFADLAAKYSQDNSNKDKAGDLGWFRQGAMVKPFNDSCFVAKKGSIFTVETQFGVHIVELLDKGAEKKQVKLAIVDKTIEPGSKTFQAYFAKATDFASNANSPEAFDKIITEKGLNKRVAENVKESDKTISGLESPREMIRWAYNEKTEEGSISKVFEFADKFVVARLVEIKEKGILPLNKIKTEVEVAAKKEKKANQFVSEFAAAKAATIDEIGQKMNLPVEKADNVKFINPILPMFGREPKVVGTVAALNENQVSEPIEGESGVYVVIITSSPKVDEPKDYTSQKTKLQQGFQSRVDYEAYNALEKKADVVDKRAKFY